MWIDSHCHLDAPEFEPDREAVVERARAAGVRQLVLPAVERSHFAGVQALARRFGLVYALGIHPLYVDRAADEDLDALQQALREARDDPQLVAVGEIGLDHFVPGLDRERQERFYRAQLRLAREAGLPVILHVRRSADALLAGLRRTPVPGGIAHAFNGSEQQALAFGALGLRLGFGGAMTHDRALQIRRLAATLPDTLPVLETDAPDIPPHWLYRSAAQRAAEGAGHARNEPAELPRIAQTLAALRGWTLEHTARQTVDNLRAALPRLAAWMDAPAPTAPPGRLPAEELQGLPHVADERARLLVLGSFPGQASLREQQYYAHPRNQFWPLVSTLLGLDLMSLPYAQRLLAVQARGLAIWDVHAACQREGSLDSDIRQARPNDLAGLVARLPALRGLAHLGTESARSRRLTQALGLPVWRLPSSSPANASWSFERKLAAWREAFLACGLIDP
ncbi:MAG: DNA-deoxyinosine glycosylase [Rubrivivax sp.]|nr:DNA-deoxyinosine glycosylase [Rubrivivax sp.]